ncbi:hypothetical protein QUB29_19490 [Microcoleus sp. B4b_D2]|uniref:hypothetical protein n=1 Tax=Microcoleus sp. B4b_D2 TaxID=3055310 RepID=UPI002FCF933E
MPTNFVNIRGDNYVSDRGGDPIPYRTRFNRPPSMLPATVADILATLAVQETTLGEKVACLNAQTFEPRRLKFTFANGGSISLPVPTRDQIIPTALAIRNTLQTDLGINVVCVSLIGEEWKRLDQELRPAGVTPTPGVDVRPVTGTKNPVYTAAISYESDSGRTFVEKVRMNSNVVNAPFSPYSAEIGTAIGTVLPRGCGSATSVDPRRYVVDVLTTNVANPVRKMIIPVADDDAADILQVGTDLATNPQTLCLRYYGESDNTFSRFLT